jgi:hypothetical protein
VSKTAETFVRELRAAGVGRVSDSFLAPILDTGPRHAAIAPVSARNSTTEYSIRVADVPFELLPAKRANSRRPGAYFAFGPGLTVELREHPGVLQLQIEGSPPSVEASLVGLRSVMAPFLSAARELREDEPGGLWTRYSLAALVGGD